jgi:hypothetical protein
VPTFIGSKETLGRDAAATVGNPARSSSVRRAGLAFSARTRAALLTLSEFIEANTYTASYAGNPPYLKSSATGSYFYLGTPFFGLG